MTHHLTENSKAAEGFSLIELLVSMTIASILILGMAQLICHSYLVKRKTDCSVRAAELACQKTEHLRTLVWQNDELDKSQSEKLTDERLNHTFLREWQIHDLTPQTKRIEIHCFAINHPRKNTKFVLILSGLLGF